jgi:hypothetical protein
MWWKQNVMRFTVVQASNAVILIVTMCSFLCGYQCFGGKYRPHLQGTWNFYDYLKRGDYTFRVRGGLMFLWNIGSKLQDYIASQLRRPQSTNSIAWWHNINSYFDSILNCLLQSYCPFGQFSEEDKNMLIKQRMLLFNFYLPQSILDLTGWVSKLYTKILPVEFTSMP